MIHRKKIHNDSAVQPKLVVNDEESVATPSESIVDGSDTTKSDPCLSSPEQNHNLSSTESLSADPARASCQSAKRASRFDNETWRCAPPLMMIYGALVMFLTVYFLPPVVTQKKEVVSWKSIITAATDAYRQKNFPKARSLFIKAGITAKSLYGTSSEEYRICLTNLTRVFEDEQNFSSARQVISKLRKLSPEAQLNFKLTQVLTYPCLLRLDKPFFDYDRYDATAAKIECTEYIQQMRPFMDEISPGLVKPYSMLAKACRFQKDYPAALDCLFRILKIREQTQGKESVGASEARVEIGDLYLEWGHQYFQAGNDAVAVTMFSLALQEYADALKMHAHFDQTPSEFNIALRQKLAVSLVLFRKLQQNAVAMHRHHDVVQTACDQTTGVAPPKLQRLETLEDELRNALGD